MHSRLFLAGLIVLAAYALPAHAGKTHVHGEGKLDVVIEKGTLTINLELPLDVAVGFERAPKTEKEKADLAATEKLLADTTLFVPTPAAQCTAQPVALSMPKFDGKSKEEHSDIDATYSFRCAAPAALKHIETGMFKHFKRLYRLEARRVGPDGQGAMRLSPKQPAMHW